ncbi:VOC family protein [Mucilaginibacter sp. UYCu711]|uniref:VOC family protein n=1 Tax=Mucilaginibacter sp. UYCu711 TaxID=3156339 RepID=UPI003D1BC08A
MQFIPLFKVRDMRTAIRHYTEVLDFVMTWPEDTEDSPVVDLGHEQMELQITTHESERLFGSIVNVWVDDVDSLFAFYKSRGLDNSNKPNSPVHQGPTDQTWGRREFYVTDNDGNSLRFVQPIK